MVRQRIPASNQLSSLFAERIGGGKKEEEVYKFEKIKQAKREALRKNPGKELIDLGIGEPHEMADGRVVRRLAEEAEKPENRFYADNGIDEFKNVAAVYLREVFGVDAEPEREINHVMGAKSALAMIPYACIDPGDITIMPAPNYPILGIHTKFLGGQTVEVPLLEENNFLPDLESLPSDICKKAKLLYLNYPNNPTGAVATEDFFERVVHFARKNGIIVVHDAAYAALVFEGEKPLSFLSIPGAKEVGIEVHSLSKSFNMTGWRIGFIAGNHQVVSAVKTVKNTFDSGQFIPIQKAAMDALSHPEITSRMAGIYSRRMDRLADIFRSSGFSFRKPRGGFFLYTRIPKAVEEGPTFDSAESFSEYLLEELLISTVPWDDAGSYIRLSVTFPAEGPGEEERIFREIRSRLKRIKFIF